MSKKNEQLQKLFKKVTVRVSLPKVVDGMPLLEQGMLAVLVRHMPQEKAESFIAALKKAYPEWNEVRVCQTEEIAAAIRGGKATRDKLSPLFPPARDAREYLQEVFQKTHGMELDSLRDDPAGNAKALAQMPVLGTAATAQVLALANGGKLPIHPPLVRLLERAGIVAKGGLKKAKDLGEFFPEGDNSTLERVGEVVDRWCHQKQPICQECVLVEDCPFGKKAFQEWKVQQARAAAQREREEARRAVLEKKEQERLAKEAARLAKKNEVIRQKQEREAARKAAIEAKKKAVEAEKQKKIAEAAKKKLEAQKAKEKAALAKQKAAEAAKKKAEAEAAKKEAAKKELAKKEAAKKEAAKKEAAQKKAEAAKKEAARKKAEAAKKAAKKK